MQRTISEHILSTKARREALAGEIVVCGVDLVIGTDASAPMAIDYFEQMGGTTVFDPSRIVFALASSSREASPMIPELWTKWVSDPNVSDAVSNTRSISVSSAMSPWIATALPPPFSTALTTEAAAFELVL
jgi:homoaconitase/3-isopropylmalate dehydratase large subunit